MVGVLFTIVAYFLQYGGHVGQSQFDAPYTSEERDYVPFFEPLTIFVVPSGLRLVPLCPQVLRRLLEPS